MDQKKYWVWLHMLPGVGLKKLRLLMEYFKSPKNLWDCSKRDFPQIYGFGDFVINNIFEKKYRDDIEEYMHKISKIGINVITIEDDDYPTALKNIHEPPMVLFVKGNAPVLKKDSIAIVGSRKATEYGLEMAKKLAYELSSRGIAVVSGMARGVDTQAHLGTLEANGETIGVLGCGIDCCYPSENKRLIQQSIVNGAVISEYGLGVEPHAGHFPARNRIISGISMGVIVIEAGEKSGSLITADLALEQGREVFAVPGNADSEKSKGSNMLIKEGAKLVTSVEDILEEFKHIKIQKAEKDSDKISKALPPNLSQEERNVVRLIEKEQVHVDLVGRKTGYSPNKLNSILVLLELKGLITQHPGNFYTRA